MAREERLLVDPASSASPTTPSDHAAPSSWVRDEGRARRGRWLRGIALTGVILAAIGGLLFWWMHSRIVVSTDNVYVVGNITPISAAVSGTVVALYVDDNMVVQPGDPIAQIDPVPFQMNVDRDLADLAQARAEADAAEITVHLTREDRKSLLEGAMAKRYEAEEGVRAAEAVMQASGRVYEKQKELLGSLQAQQPGLEALAANARDYYTRYNRLAGSGDISVQERDNREAAYREAMAKLESLKSNIAAAEHQVLASNLELKQARVKLEQSKQALANAVAAVGQAEAEQWQPKVASAKALALRNEVSQAEEKLRLARLDLSNTLIRAPQAGIISRRTIQLGQTVEARRPFLSIVPLDLDNVWAVANLREDQMKRVRVGQPAVIHVDAIPERSFAGWVESVSGGTGSVFSLFPADNATGNFTRIVQRLPVRIRFTDKENYQNRIRPGMSAVVTIDTTRFVRQSIQEW